MVNDYHRHLIAVGNSLQPSHNIVVTAVAEIRSANLTHPFQSVDDDQAGVGMLFHKAANLFYQPAICCLTLGSEIQVFSSFLTKHPVQPPLQSGVVILQCKVKNARFSHLIVPKRHSGTDLIGKLHHQKALAHLWGTGQQIGSPIEQTINQRFLPVKGGVIERFHGNRFQMVRSHSSLHFPVEIIVRPLEI